jgi:hypothetical protein
MKKFILSILMLAMVSFSAIAQVYPSAVGLRGNVGNYGIGPELSYQHGIGDINRAEVGLGFGTDNSFNRIGITGAFHWVGEVHSGFSWYAGPGIQGWLYSFNKGFNNKNVLINNGSAVGGAVGAQIGVEYDFNEDLDLPFTASVDSRPMFNFVNYYSGFEFSVAVSIHYTF